MVGVEYIKKFMQAHYTDQQLYSLLAHIQDGKLSFRSCCCFVGIPTANHALQGEVICANIMETHYRQARSLKYAYQAEGEFMLLGKYGEHILNAGQWDRNRRERLELLVLEEIDRREKNKEVYESDSGDEHEWSDSDTTREMLQGVKIRR